MWGHREKSLKIKAALQISYVLGVVTKKKKKSLRQSRRHRIHIDLQVIGPKEGTLSKFFCLGGSHPQVCLCAHVPMSRLPTGRGSATGGKEGMTPLPENLYPAVRGDSWLFQRSVFHLATWKTWKKKTQTKKDANTSESFASIDRGCRIFGHRA